MNVIWRGWGLCTEGTSAGLSAEIRTCTGSWSQPREKRSLRRSGETASRPWRPCRLFFPHAGPRILCRLLSRAWLGVAYACFLFVGLARAGQRGCIKEFLYMRPGRRPLCSQPPGPGARADFFFAGPARGSCAGFFFCAGFSFRGDGRGAPHAEPLFRGQALGGLFFCGAGLRILCKLFIPLWNETSCAGK